MDNRERRERGQIALNSYMSANRDYGDESPITEEAIIDCIADILHFAKTEKTDIAAICNMAQMHVEEE